MSIPLTFSPVNRFIILTWSWLSGKEQARWTGQDYVMLCRRRQRLIRAGLVKIEERANLVPWTDDDDNRLLEMLQRGISMAHISEQLGRSVSGVYERSRRKLGGIKGATGEIKNRTMRQVAQLFGVTFDVAHRWHTRGWLKAQRNNASATLRVQRHLPLRGKGLRTFAYYVINDLDLQEFLSERRAWASWSPGQMTDQLWREEAQRIRDAHPGHWVTPQAVAHAIYHVDEYVYEALHGGRLPATKVGRFFYIWSTDADRFIAEERAKCK